MEGDPSVVVVLRRAQTPLFKQPEEDDNDKESPSSSSPPTTTALKPIAVEEEEEDEDDVSLGEVSRMGFDADSRGFAAESTAAAEIDDDRDDDAPSAVVLMKDGGTPLASASAVAAESVVVAAPLAQLLSPIARTAAVAAAAAPAASAAVADDDSRGHPQADEEAEQQSSIRGGCCFGGSFVAVDGEEDDVDMCMQEDDGSSGTARPQSPWPPPPLSPFSAAASMMDVDEDNSSRCADGNADADGAAPEICELQQQQQQLQQQQLQQLQQSGYRHHSRTATIVDAVRAQLGQRALSAAATAAKGAGAGAGATASREAEVALEGRESEMEQLRVHLAACAFAGIPGCMFVTGAAGTGKTSAVRAVVADFLRAREEEEEQEEEQAKEKWAVAWVNCVRFAQGTPADIFASLCRSLGVEEAGSRGSGRMGSARGGGGDAGVLERALERRVCEGGPAVVVVDEADSLFARGRRRALFAALSWPLLAGSRAVVIAISNAARPPATFWKKLQSRMGIWRVHFGPYGADALERIATARVASADADADASADACKCGSAVLGADAIHTLAVRLAVTCGDARRMLGLCNAAIDAALDRRRHRHNHQQQQHHRSSNSESGKEEEEKEDEEEEEEEALDGFTREHPLVEMQDVDAAVAELLLADPLAAGISALSAPLGVLLAAVVRRAMLLGGGGGNSAGGAWVSAADALEDAQRVWSSTTSGGGGSGGKHSHAAGMAGAPRCWRDAVCALGELEAMGLVRVIAVPAAASPSSGAMAGAGEFCGCWEDMPQFSATAAPTRVVLRAGLGHTARLWRVQAAVDRETLLASLSSPAHGDHPSASASAAREILLRT